MRDLHDTGLHVELDHLTIKTRLIDERFPSVMGECVIVTLQVRRIFKVIRSTTTLTRILSIFDLIWVENVVWYRWNWSLV
jgi:hypothetical protein